jgi:predicted membrane channel-forming protein YqfA (hemolysin III family)
MDISQSSGDNSVLIGVNFGNVSVTYNSKIMLSPAEIHMKVLQIDELLSQHKPKSIFEAFGKTIFSFLLSAGILYCLSLVVVFMALVGMDNSEAAGTVLSIFLFAVPIFAIGITIWRHISENEKINEKRKTLEKIKHLYISDLRKE